MSVLKFLLASCFCVVIIGTFGNEINNLRKELDNELLALEKQNAKKSVDNIQVATVTGTNDAALDHLLKYFKKPKRIAQGKKINKDSVMKKDADEELLNLLLEKEDEKRETDKSDDSVAKKEAEAKEALLKAFMEDEKKKKREEAKENEISMEKKEAKATQQLLKAYVENEQKNKREAVNKSQDVDEDTCRDEIDYCDLLKPYCKSKAHEQSMRDRCSKSCDFCKPCVKDVWDRKVCQRVSKYCKMDKYASRLKKTCHETCGYCRAPAPPACQNDIHGCCWDGTSIARNGCPLCKDNRNVGKVCKSFKDACRNKAGPGKWMTLNCPVSCNKCDPSKACYDHAKVENCKKWKDEGQCNVMYGTQLCPKTCGICKS